jgi:hypothetical protein
MTVARTAPSAERIGDGGRLPHSIWDPSIQLAAFSAVREV